MSAKVKPLNPALLVAKGSAAATPSLPARGAAESDDDLVNVAFLAPRAFRRRLKDFANSRDMTVREVLTAAFEQYARGHK